MYSFQPTDRVFSHALYIFPFDTYAPFALLQTRLHERWARLLSSSMKNDLRYAATDCFETFPFPPDTKMSTTSALERIGAKLYQMRAKLMVDRDQGLTTTYNQLKDPEVEDLPIRQLRELHIKMDAAVLAAYGWQDIIPPPFTTPITPEEKYLAQEFEDEVLDRLFELNKIRST